MLQEVRPFQSGPAKICGVFKIPRPSKEAQGPADPCGNSPEILFLLHMSPLLFCAGGDLLAQEVVQVLHCPVHSPTFSPSSRATRNNLTFVTNQPTDLSGKHSQHSGDAALGAPSDSGLVPAPAPKEEQPPPCFSLSSYQDTPLPHPYPTQISTRNLLRKRNQHTKGS